jgi:hypothetical protein
MNKTVTAVCVTAVLIAIIGVVGWITYVGADTGRLAWGIGAIVGPLLMTGANFLKTSQVRDDTSTVRHRTNGPLDEVFTRLRKIENLLVSVTPPVPDAPAVTRDTEGRPPSVPG